LGPSSDNGATITPYEWEKKVQGEFGLIYLCYNFKRILIILGLKGLKEALEARIFNFMDKMNMRIALWAHKTIPLIFPILLIEETERK